MKIVKDFKDKIIGSQKKDKTRRSPVLSSEIAALSAGENSFKEVIEDIGKLEKTSNDSTIEKLKQNHKKHMNSFMSNERFDEIVNEKRNIAEEFKETEETEESEDLADDELKSTVEDI